MAFLPLPIGASMPDAGIDNTSSNAKGRTMVMFLFVVGFIAFLAVASTLGWTKDSRDGSDWTASDGGIRVRRKF